MSFYTILPSNSCELTQPNNNASSYIVDWESPLVLDRNWEVALTDYSLNRIVNYFPTITYISFQEFTDKTDVIQIKIVNNNIIETEYWDDPTTVYKDYLRFNISQKGKIKFTCYLCSIKVQFDSLETANSLGFTKLLNFNPEQTGGFEVEAPNDFKRGYTTLTRVSIIFSTKIEKNHILAIDRYEIKNTYDETEQYFQKHLAAVFSSFKINQNGICSMSLKPEIKSLYMETRLKRALGIYQPSEIYIKGSIVGKSKVILNISFYHLYIYSSLVDPILVGGVKVPLLHSLWLDNTIEDNINESVETLMYLPISMTSINKIEIQIRDDAGNIIEFPYGSKTSLTLHFRKANEFLHNS